MSDERPGDGASEAGRETGPGDASRTAGPEGASAAPGPAPSSAPMSAAAGGEGATAEVGASTSPTPSGAGAPAAGATPASDDAPDAGDPDDTAWPGSSDGSRGGGSGVRAAASDDSRGPDAPAATAQQGASDTTDGLGPIDGSKHELPDPARAPVGATAGAGGGGRSARPLRHSTRVRAMYARELDDTASSPAVRPPDGLSSALPPPADHPRVVTFALAVLLVAVFVSLGGGATLATLDPRALGRAGLLAPGSVEPWRLVHATFVHSNALVLALSTLLVVVFGGEVERRSGSALVAFLVVALGAALNAARVIVEPAAGLLLLAGAWPVGLALGGAALALATLSPRRGRGPWGLAAALAGLLVLVVGTLGLVGRHADALGAGLQAVMFLSLGGGLVVGLVVASRSRRPVHPATAEVTGCLLGGLVLTALLGAEGQRRTGASSSPLPPAHDPRWGPSPGLDLTPVDLPSMRPLDLADLGLALDVPPEWQVETPTEELDCPACKQKVSVLAGVGPDAPAVPCPRCDAPVRPPARAYVNLDEPALFGARRVRVFSRPRQPYDAPDMQAQRFLADVGKGQFLPGAELLEDRPVEGRLGGGHALVMRGSSSGRTLIYRTWFFVGARRSVQVDAIVDDVDGAARATAPVHEAVARSVRELP